MIIYITGYSRIIEEYKRERSYSLKIKLSKEEYVNEYNDLNTYLYNKYGKCIPNFNFGNNQRKTIFYTLEIDDKYDFNIQELEFFGTVYLDTEINLSYLSILDNKMKTIRLNINRDTNMIETVFNKGLELNDLNIKYNSISELINNFD